MEHRDQIVELETLIRTADHTTNVIVGGDFNAKSYALGSAYEDKRGKILGSQPTYSRPTQNQSLV